MRRFSRRDFLRTLGTAGTSAAPRRPPLHVPTEALKDLKVLTTIIGGSVEFCAPGAESLCPA